MLLKRAAQNLAEMRHLKAVDPSGAQTCPALLPDDLVQREKYRYTPRRLGNQLKTKNETLHKEQTNVSAPLSPKYE